MCDGFSPFLCRFAEDWQPQHSFLRSEGNLFGRCGRFSDPCFLAASGCALAIGPSSSLAIYVACCGFYALFHIFLRSFFVSVCSCVHLQEVTSEGKGSKQIGMDMYTFCEALGPEEVRFGQAASERGCFLLQGYTNGRSLHSVFFGRCYEVVRYRSYAQGWKTRYY